MEVDLDEVITQMPKVELHAHLNGSISEDLLNHLKCFEKRDSMSGHEEFPDVESEGILMGLDAALVSTQGSSSAMPVTRNLQECWKVFSRIHEVIRTPRILYVATLNVIAEFARDNVIYLELRTSPKKVHSFSSKKSYVDTVIKGIKDAQKKFPIVVKLLISVDRKNGEQEGFEAITLAKEAASQYPEVVVGLDVSGDPNHGHSSWIVKIMQEARKEGLKISCHLPEIVNPEEGMEFIKFGPERVGHGQFLHPLYGGTKELWELTKLKRIPIETCISSNLVSGVAASEDKHIVKIFYGEGLPFIICTDDCGVFNVTLSGEFKKFARVTPVTPSELRQLCLDAVTYSFAQEHEKNTLTCQIKKWWSDNNTGIK